MTVAVRQALQVESERFLIERRCPNPQAESQAQTGQLR